MLRRTVLQWIATATGTLPFPLFRAWSQTVTFPGKHQATLRQIAGIVLPAELGRDGADRMADRFERWVREYRPSAEMEHGYGFPRLRSKPPSPAPGYLIQLESLREPLSAPNPQAKQKTIETALEQANIKDLPRAPDGKHVIADLMSFYFHGSDANDLCYRAAIQRETCRGLKGSDHPPPPLRGPA
jgi:hypothetical protein